MAREHANVVEMGYGYRDGVPYALGGQEPIKPVTGVADLVDVWRYRSNIRGGGPLRICTCGYPITVVDGRWDHLFNMAVLINLPTRHDTEPAD